MCRGYDWKYGCCARLSFLGDPRFPIEKGYLYPKQIGDSYIAKLRSLFADTVSIGFWGKVDGQKAITTGDPGCSKFWLVHWEPFTSTFGLQLNL